MLFSAAPPASADTERISAATQPAKRARATFSFRPWFSADGRWVAFDTDASLVPEDTNHLRDVYLYDRTTNEATLVSKGVEGEPGDGESQRPTVSADGAVVAFWSDATNLVDGDANGVSDAFVYDHDSASVRRVSIAPDGKEANGASARPAISADGRTVAFESAATNLVVDPLLPRSADTNKARDVFVVDLSTGELTRASVASDGAEGTGDSVRPTVSHSGRFIAFQTDSVFDPADTNVARDVYVKDTKTGKTTLVSTGPGNVIGDGGSFSPSISADGNVIAFWSNAGNLVGSDNNRASDVFVKDMSDGTIERVSVGAYSLEGNGGSSDPAISPDGRYVAFWSLASNLVAGDTNGKSDIFLVDRSGPTLVRASVASNGTEGDADSYSPNVTDNGLVVFDSRANTLVPDDTNNGSDIFIHTQPSS